MMSNALYKHIFIIALLAVLLKLPFITNPISDWQSWNQVTTMANAKYIYQEGWDAFWNPKVDVFETPSIESNRAAAEMPLLPGVIALFYHLSGENSESAGRLAAILFSVIGTIYFYLLVLETTNSRIALLAVGMYLIAPMVWYFHRTVMTDVPMVAFVTAGLYHFRRWIETEAFKQILLSMLFTSLAALFKAYALYIGIAYLLMILDAWGWKKLLRPQHLLLVVVAWLPLILWMWHGAQTVQDGVTGNNLTSKTELLGPISLWWNPQYWIRLQITLTELILFRFGILGFFAAFFYWREVRKVRVLVFWLLSVLFYFLFVRDGNLVHDYYKMPLTEPVIFLAAIGWYHWVASWKHHLSAKKIKIILGVIIALSIADGAEFSRYKTNIDPSPVELGRKLFELNKGKKYVIIYDADGLQRNQALFYSGTQGWHFKQFLSLEKVEEYKANGAAFVGIILKKKELKSNADSLAEYDRKFERVWEHITSGRYDEEKHILIYRI